MSTLTAIGSSLLATVLGVAAWSLVRLEMVHNSIQAITARLGYRPHVGPLHPYHIAPSLSWKPREGRGDLLLLQDAIVRVVAFPAMAIVAVAICLALAIVLIRPRFGHPRAGLKQSLFIASLWRSIALLAVVFSIAHLLWLFFFGVYSAAWNEGVSVGVSVSPSRGLMMLTGSLVAWLGGTFAIVIRRTQHAKARIGGAENRCEFCGYEGVLSESRCPECGRNGGTPIGKRWIGRATRDKCAALLRWTAIAVALSALGLWTSPRSTGDLGISTAPAHQPQRLLFEMRSMTVLQFQSIANRYLWLLDDV